MNEDRPWWTRDRHADRRAALLLRGRITAAVRGWFAGKGFTEIETAIVQVSPGNETHLHAPAVHRVASDGGTQTRYLRTSPEFAAKKLLAAGETKIFEFARVFRDREHGALHLPEFTMLEWYRADEDYQSVIDDSVDVIRLATTISGAKGFSFRGHACDPFAPAERVSVAAAFARFAGIDVLATVRGAQGDREALAALAAPRMRVSDDDTWSDLFSKILVEHVEPKLGVGCLTVLDEYPTPEAALARVSAYDHRVSERFEIYACGVELANGFGELNDAVEQRRRFDAAMDEKERRYGERYPLDEELLAALALMPDASGVALGFDRLVMLAAGAQRLDQVIWTPPVAPS